jgi:hypothetical protein
MWMVGRCGLIALCLMYNGTLPSLTSLTLLEESDNSQDVGLWVGIVQLIPEDHKVLLFGNTKHFDTLVSMLLANDHFVVTINLKTPLEFIKDGGQVAPTC